MSEPQATIVVVPRERFSHSERTLQNIYDNTTFPFNLIYVSGGSPEPLRRRLEEESQRKGFQLIHTGRYLSPNEARNLGARQTATKYVVFIDNDALVTRGWLDALVACAEETGAWVVGPLYFIGELDRRIVHMAGGTVHVRAEGGRRMMYEEQYYLNTPFSLVNPPLRRQACGHMEFHCLLARTDVFQKLGPLDEGLLSINEHIDFCIAVRQSGGTVYIEPGAVTTYIPPRPAHWSDLPFFLLRWGDDWNLSTMRHFNRKWEISGFAHVSDKANGSEEDTIVRFARGHRRIVSGIRVSDSDEDRPRTPLEQAELMIAMFQSVDRDSLDLTVQPRESDGAPSTTASGPQAILECLRRAMQEADLNHQNVMIRLRPPKRPQEPAIVRVDDVDRESLRAIEPFAFLILETRPGSYQCWLAMDRGNLRTSAVLRRLAQPSEQAGLNSYARLAGSRSGDGCEIRLASACAGLVNTMAYLESKDVLLSIRNGLIY